MSRDLEILEPILLRVSVVEIQEAHFPSFRTELEAVLEHPTGRFCYSASDLWFSTGEWDAFASAVAGLDRFSATEAELLDLSEAFRLRLSVRNPRCFDLVLKCSEPDTGRGEGSLVLSRSMEKETFSILASKVSQFPKWW